MKMRQWKSKFCALVLSLTMVAAPILSVETAWAASTDGIYAAAYQGATSVADTTLPEKVTVNGTEKSVTWDLRASKLATPYSTVQITGTTSDSKAVSAQVEVIPAKTNELVYFIDAGRDAGKESKAFASVNALTDATLINDVADQVYDATDKWGRTNSGIFTMKSEGDLDLTQKILTGWYSNTDVDPLTYQFYLEAGTYTVSAGFYEWWSTSARNMTLKVSGTDVAAVSSETISLTSKDSAATTSLVFEVKKAGDVKLEVINATNGEAPVISWFAVAKGKMTVAEAPVEAEVVINGADVEKAAKNVNGLTYKGFGLLSGNSTSDLLMDYKQESPDEYWEMMEVLFGGDTPVINHVKMEMGNDGNNSTGADSCTMRTETEEADVSRSPGFQLAADAKTINPDVKVSFLRWQMPAWVAQKWNSNRTGAGYEAVYTWYRETIFDAYEKYGYVVDYVSPDKNETTDPDESFIKWIKNRIANETDFPDYMDEEACEAYNNIKIIASDENTHLNIVPSMRNDKELYDAVDAIGFHYSTGDTNSTRDYRNMAVVDDKEVWYSEGCATFSYSEYHENKNVAYGAGTIGGFQGPLALADNFIKSFVYSHKTHYIFQPAIGSFYEGAQYDHKEIISAREPWAGYIHYDPMIYMLQHFSKFSVTGWENEDNSNGIWRVIPESSANNSSGYDHLKNESGNPSYLTLASPDKKDVSVVVVNNSKKTASYTIKLNNMDIKAGAPMEVWETKTDSYLQYVGEADYANGVYTVTVEPYSMVTITSLDCNSDKDFNERLPEEVEKAVLDTDETGQKLDDTDDILYADDYEYKGYDEDYLPSRGNEPRYTVDVTGAFEVRDGEMVQLLKQSVEQWNGGDPNCIVGDFRWMNYKASVDVVVTGSSYAGINIRQQTGMQFEGSGYNFRITKDGSWTLKERGTTLKTGKAAASADGSYNLALEGKNNVITAWVDGVQVATYTDPTPEYIGRVRLGCGFQETVFDNLLVETVEGCEPYATTLIDNAADDINYDGNWSIKVAGDGASSNDWYRSTSTTSTPGASFSFEMDGQGLMLVGQNDGSAILDVVVDDVTYTNVSTMPSSQHYSTYSLKNLGEGKHDVTVEVVSGTLVLDAVMTTPYRDDSYDLVRVQELINKIDSFILYDYSQANAVKGLRSAYELLTDDQKELMNKEKDYDAVITALEAAVAELEGTTSYIQDQSKNAIQIPFDSTASFKKSGDEVVMSGYLSVPSEKLAPSLQGKNSFTVEVTVTPTGSPSFNQFAGKGDYAFALRATTTVDFHIYDGSNWRSVTYTMPADVAANWLNNEHHVAGIYDADAGQIRLFVDGAMVASATAGNNTVAPSEYNFTIGACPDTGRTSAADFAEVRVYNKALTAEELNAQVTDTPAYAADHAAVELWVDFDTIAKEINVPDPTPTPTPTPTPPTSLPYEDVVEGDWFYEAVAYTYYEGLMTGMDPTHFGPYGTLSRAQFALILHRMEGETAVETTKSFGDIAGDEWYGPAVLWAAEKGIVTGYTDGNFGPVDLITREQMAVMMYRYAKYLGQDVEVDANFDDFKDAASVSEFAVDAMKWAVGNGIITGKENGTVLDPQGNTARSEAAIIIQRFMQK